MRFRCGVFAREAPRRFGGAPAPNVLRERKPVKAKILMISLCAISLFASGCSSPCESACASFNDCELSQRDHDVDCSSFCAREEQFEEDASASGGDSCATQFDAYISCWDSNVDKICDKESTSCDESLTAWTDCMGKFCAVEANVKNHACVPQDPDDMGNPPDPLALPALAGF